MYARLVERYVRRTYEHFNEGDAEPAIRRFAEGARLVFRGHSRLAADLRGTAQISSWLRELMRLGLRWQVHDVLVRGFPWNTRAVARYTVTVRPTQDGGRVFYRGFQYARIRWGRVHLDEIMPDTLAAARSFPPRLSASAPAPAPAPRAAAPAVPGSPPA